MEKQVELLINKFEKNIIIECVENHIQFLIEQKHKPHDKNLHILIREQECKEIVRKVKKCNFDKVKLDKFDKLKLALEKRRKGRGDTNLSVVSLLNIMNSI